VARSSGAWSAFYRAGTARGERTREVTGRRQVESINGDSSSKGRRRSSRFMRGNEEEVTAHRFNCSRVDGPRTVAHVAGQRRWRLGRREVEDDRGDGPNGPVWPNGPAWQLGWRRVSGQIQGFE
jgi:hypothetical protein